MNLQKKNTSFRCSSNTFCGCHRLVNNIGRFQRGFSPQFIRDIQQSSFYENVFKKTLTTLRGCIYFWMGVLFPFVSDMRHKLLNLSSVRHSTNLQFMSEGFSVGWNCCVTQKGGKSSVNWYTAMCWVSHEMAACLGMLKKGFLFLFLNKTCPSHHKTCHRPLLPRASTGVQWYTLITLAITI